MIKAGVAQLQSAADSIPEGAGESPASRSILVERAISLTQPWATLVAIGAKRIETRSWEAKYRGWIAIHAAKAFPRDCMALCSRGPFCDSLEAADLGKPYFLPTAAVIAVAELYDCRCTEDLDGKIDRIELAFGNYSPFRFGFLTRGARRLRKPIPMRGMLGIWRMPQTITEADLL